MFNRFRLCSLGALLLGGSLFAPAFAADSVPLDAKSTFERLKALAGTWRGTAMEDGKSQELTVIYRVASGGSVVMETVGPGLPQEMISMYHLEGDELVLVHYCAIGNQPKLKLDRTTSTSQTLRFDYLAGTNLVPEKDAHIHSAVFHLNADGSLDEDWGFWQGGKIAGVNRFSLKRADG